MNGNETQPLRMSGKKFLSLREINDMGELHYLLKPFIQANVQSALVGESDVGKSTFARQLAVCIAAGKEDCAGFELNAPNRSVLYCALEENKQNVKLAIIKQAKELNVEVEDIQDNIVIVSEPDDLLKIVREAFADRKYDVVIVDPYSAAIASEKFNNNTNHDTDVRKFLNPFHRLCDEHGCAVLWIHHKRKPSGNAAAGKHDVNGSGAFPNAMRNVIELKSVNAEAGQFAAVILKGNDNTPEEKKANYLLNRSGFSFQSAGLAASFPNGKEQMKKEMSADKEKQIEELLMKRIPQSEVAQLVSVSLSTVSKIAKRLKQREIIITDAT